MQEAMITRYGMSKKFGMMGIETAANQYLNDRTVMNCSDETAAEVDREVMKVLEESYEKAKQLLNEHREALDKIAAYLIEKETITGKEFMEILEKVEQPKEEPVQEEAPEQAGGIGSRYCRRYSICKGGSDSLEFGRIRRKIV